MVIIKWILVAVAFQGDMIVGNKVFIFDPEEIKVAADCEKARDKLIADAKESGIEIWAECREVKRDLVKPTQNERGAKS